MSACEKCWRDANWAASTLGGNAVTHYQRLLKERENNPCEPANPQDVRAYSSPQHLNWHMAKGEKRCTCAMNPANRKDAIGGSQVPDV